MKKTSVFLTLCIMLGMLVFPTAQAAEYDYLVEGEAMSTHNFTGDVIKTDTAANGGKYAALWTTTAPALGFYYADYKVTVGESGVYDMEAVMTSVMNSSWGSNVYVRVNGGTEYRLTAETQSREGGNSQYRQRLDSVNLKSGENKIRFIVRNPRTDGYYTFFIDFFTLTKSEIRVRSITTEAPYSVFTTDEEIKLSINANACVSEDTSLSYKIVNVENTQISEGTAVIKSGQKSAEVLPGKLAKGYYEITSGGCTQGFSVVKPLSERKTYDDTPFAVDTNFSSSAVEHYKADYAEVLALSGVSWIRERLWLKNYTSYSDGEYTLNYSGIDGTAAYVKPYGIKISVAADYMPSELLGDYGKYIPTDLIESYKYWKQVDERYKDKADAWEIFNECDLGGAVSASDSPDLYASFMKAAALGLADTGVIAMTQGAAAGIGDNTEYVEMLMKNDIFDYSATDNAHYHRGLSDNADKYYSFVGRDNVKKHIEEQMANNSQAPVWVTEAGISMNIEETRNMNLTEQRAQAKYLVTSTVESIASGTDKHFFFVGPSYWEGSKNWSMTSEGILNPYMYASLSAQSAMTDILGKGEYLGKINGLPEGVSGYAFSNGEENVAVIWSAEEKNVSTGLNAVKAYDMYGNEKTSSEALSVSNSPVYIVYSGSSDSIVSERRKQESISLKSFTDASRIILTQKYSDGVRGGARTDGYTFSANDTVTVEVTNLNDKAVTGKIVGSFKNGSTLTENEKSITVPANSVGEVTFEAEAVRDDYLTFTGVFDCGTTSGSTAKITSRKDGAIIVEAEDGKASAGFEKYTSTAGSVGLTVQTKEVKDYTVELTVQAPADGFYKMWVLAQQLDYKWNSNYEITLNGKKLAPMNVNNDDTTPAYWQTNAALGWDTFGAVKLKKGSNKLVYTVGEVCPADEYLIAAFDKVAFLKIENSYGYREAEKYSAKTGAYTYEGNSSASGKALMSLFTYQIPNPPTDNSLSYDIYTESRGNYDIWVLTSKPNVGYLTKWKYSLNGANYAAPSVSVQKDSGIVAGSNDNINLYWVKLSAKSGTFTLNKGYNNISFLGDSLRSNGDYMLHIIDAVAIVPANSWTPSGSISSDLVDYAYKNLTIDTDLTKVTDDLPLPEMPGVSITWMSSDEGAVSASGEVTRPKPNEANKTVTLTAVFKCGSVAKTKQFTVTVLKADKEVILQTGLYDNSGNAQNKLKSDNVVKTEIINETDNDFEADVYYALYNAFTGKLEEVYKKPMRVSAGERAEYSERITLTDAANHILKGFAWNGMAPLEEAFEAVGEQKSLNAPMCAGRTLYITGNIGKAGETITVSVFTKPISEIAGDPAAFVNNAVYFDEITTKSDGSYGIEVKLDEQSETYCVRIGSKAAGTLDASN